MNRGGVAVLAELLELKPFGCVASVLHCRVTGHARRTLGGVGPAFGALKSDYEPDALVFGHGKDVAPRLRSGMTVKKTTLLASRFPLPTSIAY
jgi:hypothetical protein